MDSSANRWLAQLENEELGELEFVDQLSMQQLAESLANELRQQPQEQQEQQDEQHKGTYHTPSSTGFSFVGDVDKAEGFVAAVDAGSNSMFPFTTGTSGSLNFSALEQQQHGGAAGSCCPLWEKRGGRRPTSSVQEHVIAERKRREKMHQQFATLASIIPDITKTDKVSLLGSTIEYVHQLRERVKALQEHQSTHSTAESPMFDARCCIGSDDQEDDDEAASPSWASPRIEANVRGTTVLLRIVCRQKKGVLIMVLTELEKHGLSVINTSVVPFADSSLNITITAEIEDGSSTTVELVKNLNLALQNF